MELIVYNDLTHFASADPDDIRMLDERLSYFVKGYFFSHAYKGGYWDGKQHLLKFNRKHGYTIPTGMIKDVIDLLYAHNVSFEIEDKRVEPATFDCIKSSKKINFRYYQAEAIAKIISPGLIKARCLLKMPVRSGKTLTAAEIINKLKHKTLFIVTNEMLLSQTLDVFRDYFDCPIGQAGDGIWDEQLITVATAQTLNKRSSTDQFNQLVNGAGLTIFDECHHLVGEKWRDILLSSPSKYRIGLSATAFLQQKGENERSTIWLKACCGPIIHEVSITELIKAGYLAPLNVTLIPINGPEVDGTWPEPYVSGIVKHDVRNNIVAKIAIDQSSKGKIVLIHAVRLEHIKQIALRLKDQDGKFTLMWGDTKPKDRRKRTNEFISGNTPILVGNLFKEGVDIPECDVVINAAGGKSEISTIQKLRNLTIHENKKEALLYDFSDLHNRYLAKHALQRLKTYKAENGFKLLVKGHS